MASTIWPSMLRQTYRVIPARRTLATKAVRPLTSTLHAPTTRTHFITQQASLLRSKLAHNSLPGSMRVAAFHASARQAILPAGPQHIEGTVNDPAPVPDPSPTHGSYHWTFERLIAVALVPLTVAPFAAGSLNPVMDAALCATILIHSHIGFESVIIDYIPAKRLPKTRTLFWWGLRGATLLVGVGLYEFETNDVGLTEGIKRVWTA
ncbi:MAG: succinate dehydrogenase subunit D [Lasallia pustulata]|uniref:Succinate dehydrogenase [ubiquinone] cytochrome b small subunit n=1 Tax=Lasallia pustulata TaxID=136370 RepID=A0A5M8Q2B5_9LECA|nr:MAG: succinate dehydrogenase subunit D [Lasallia pustulata]